MHSFPLQMAKGHPPENIPETGTAKKAVLLGGLCVAAAATTYAVLQGPSDGADDRKQAAVSKAPAKPTKEAKEVEDVRTPLQQKLATLDQKVYVLSRYPGPEELELYDLIREFQEICDGLLEAADTPDDVRAKACVLREAIDLYEQVKNGPQTDQDKFLKFLEEFNKDGNFDAMIAKFKAMTPEEFAEHQKKEFPTSVAASLSDLLRALQARKTIGRDEYTLVLTALYHSEFPAGRTVKERCSEAAELADDKWLANFPDRRDAYRSAREERVRAILKRYLDDPNAEVPKIPGHLRDIDDPYAPEKAADHAEQEKQLEERERLSQEILRAVERLTNQTKLTPEESNRVEEELEKARQRQKEKK